MGFKLGSKKSWKNLGKKTGNDSKDFFTKDDGKSDFFKDKDGSKEGFFKGFGNKDNWEKSGDIFVEGGNGAKKTWNAASAGVGRSMGGLNETMSNAILAGGLVLGAIIIVPMMLPDGKRE